MDPNREFAELVGLRWYPAKSVSLDPNDRLFCGKCGQYVHQEQIDSAVPDYASDPRLVLREMMKREDFPLFMARLMYMGDSVEGIDWDHNIDIDYILDTTGLLALAARDFMRKEKP